MLRRQLVQARFQLQHFLAKAVSRGDDATFVMSDVQDEQMSRGLPVLFIHPEKHLVGVAVNDWEGAATFAYDSHAQLGVYSLAEFTADANGIASPRLDRWRATGTQRLEDLRVEAAARRVELRKLSGLFGVALASLRHQQEERYRNLQERRRLEASERTAEAARRRAARPTVVPQVMSATGPWAHCRRCGGGLADVLQKRGYHAGACSRGYRW